jgi:hypothetical protein
MKLKVLFFKNLIIVLSLFTAAFNFAITHLPLTEL